MAIPLVVVAIAAAVAAASTAIAAAIAQGEIDKARAIREKVLSQYGDDLAPHLDKAIAHEAGPTALAKIQTDPETRDTQVGTMRKLSDLYDKGGMGTGDEAALQLANQGAQQRASSDYQSLQQNLAARGQGTNPALAAALASKSSGDVVNATATNRYRAQADARERAYSALRDSGTLAGTIHGQDFGEAAAKASAADRINQFNASQNTEADNENARREMQRYRAKMELANARAGAYDKIAQSHNDSARNAQQTGAGIANAAMSVGGGAAGYANGGGGGGGGFDTSTARLPTPDYGGNGSYGGSSPDEWENPYLKGGKS